MSNEINEDIGRFPVRQDITVIPPDSDGPMRLPWIVLEGSVIQKDKKAFIPFDKDNWGEHYEEIEVDELKPKFLKNRLKEFNDIKEGDIVFYAKQGGFDIKIDGVSCTLIREIEIIAKKK